MKIVDVSKKIINNISTGFIDKGFKINKRKREFYREHNGCVQILDLVFIKEGETIKIRPQIRIKIKHIEDIYHHVSKDHDDIYRVLGNDLFELIRYYDKNEETGKGEQILWKVENEKDIEKLIEVIPVYFEREILRYFEENSSIARVDELLNKYPREISIHNWLYPLRACLAIIAAKLNGNPKYDELVKVYEEELKNARNNYKEDFKNLKKFLSEEMKDHSQ